MERLSGLITGAGYLIEGIGVVIIVVGCLLPFGWVLPRLGNLGLERSYQQSRHILGRAILLGLEFLIAGDIIRTVVISPTMGSVLVLGVIVLIRTFLSITIEVEVEGRWPWQRTGTRAPPHQNSGPA